MKLFQQLLLAPAALGLMAPMAVNAAEINLNGVSEYAPQTLEVQGVSQLSDIHPSDWTFKALSEIRNSRGCNVSLPQGVITRAEAAAILNSCIGNVATLTDAELRLIDEFAPELATIKGSNEILNGFSFEAGQFSATTTLSGAVNVVVGSVEGATNEGLHSQYGYGLDLNSSFTGEDLLVAGITQGNFSTTSSLGDLDFSESDATLTVSSLYYSFPFQETAITAGPLLDQDDVTVTTSLYSDAWKLGGNPYTLPGDTGTGAAISSTFENGLSFVGSYIATNAGDPTLGIATDESDDVLSAMIGYEGDSGFGAGLIYTTLGEGSASTGYDAIGGGIYYTFDKFTLSATYDSKDDEGSTENAQAWLIGTDISVGAGTLSAAISNVPDTDANDDDETSYEVYYSYPVSDYITVTPGFFFVEGDGAAADETGVAVNTSFSF